MQSRHLLIAITCAAPSLAQGTLEDYERAERFLRKNLAPLVHNLAVEPHWIDESDRFWFLVTSEAGHEFRLVDPDVPSMTPAFDHTALAAALEKATGGTVDGARLPFQTIELSAEPGAVLFTVDGQRWSFGLDSYACTKAPTEPEVAPHEVLSPDERWVAFVRDHDLWLRELATGREQRLTHDGMKDWAYAAQPDTRLTAVTERVHGITPPPSLIWSPDSRRILTYRLDQRRVGELHLLQSVPTAGETRPTAHSYRHPLPGDWNLAEVRYLVLDVPSSTTISVGSAPTPVVHLPALDLQWMSWNDAGTRIWWVEASRGSKTLTLSSIDAATGEVEEHLSESSETYLLPNLSFGAPPNVHVLEQSERVVWFSARSGWANLWLHELETGRELHPLTPGQFIVRDVAYVDDESEHVWFTAGREGDGADPYYRRFFRAALDGSGVELLSPEEADHAVEASPSGRFFIDTYSRVDAAPVSVLRDAAGAPVLELVRADITELLATGWRYPERFTVKARDGETDLYGVLYRPVGFDPAVSYPVLDSIYPGPQINRAPASFAMAYSDLFGQGVAMAELGFVVVAIDGLGTPMRSRAFHEYSYGKLEEAGGLEDHIAGLRQLAERYPYLDLGRVGIYGGSGGGFASTRAVLAHPDFYKVAVSAAGNHDQRGYIAVWGELFHGFLDGSNYVDQANASLAANLEGKLLLAHGDLDDNVSPVLTMQVADALIRANKDFDLLILPNSSHNLGANADYFTRRQWDYFVRHLLGVEPPKEYRIGAAMEKVHERERAEEERKAILVEGASFEVLTDELAFGEGPASDAAGALYFSDIRSERICRFDPVARLVTTIREPSGKANGLSCAPGGALLICEGGERRLTRLADGQLEVLADAFEGKRLNSPNDLALDARGGIYFTDPRYGDRSNLELDVEGVYYLPPNGALVRVVDDLERPNGLVLSLDGKLLYVADNSAKTIVAFDVSGDGTLGPGREWARLDPEARGGGDGMTIDERGNVYCAGQGKIWIWTSDGHAIAQLPVFESPTNCCFGGADSRTLYVTTPSSLLRIPMRVKGGH